MANFHFWVTLFCTSYLVFAAFDEATAVIYMDGSGDSLSVGYNAVRNGLPNTANGETSGCPNAGMTGRSWGSELISSACPPTGLVISFAANVNCAGSAGANMKVANTAVSGATMLGNFKTQATTIGRNLNTTSTAGRRQVLVYMGHNDICNGCINKTTTCSNGDLDGNNYCRTATGAFEREFRDGLDSLIVQQSTNISILAPARVSQLCLVRNLSMCQPALYLPSTNNCGNAWRARLLFGDGICASLTNDCSDQRVIDAYTYEKTYRDRLLAVTTEYNNLPVGSSSARYTFNGKTVGGAVKAANVGLIFSDAMWVSQLTAADVSCCDCFHGSVKGQQRMADAAFKGVTCSAATPCCSDASSALENGKCTTTVITDNRFVPGVQL